MKVSLYASSACYFMVLSFFPLLVLILGLLRHTGLDVERLLAFLEGFVPGVLMEGTRRLIFDIYLGSSGTLLGVSALTALWSASRGIFGLLKGLNAVCDCRETRGYVYTRILSVYYTFAFLLVLLLNLVLQVFGEALLENLPYRQEPLLLFLTGAVDFRQLFLLLTQIALFCAMYKTFPNGAFTWKESLPGAVLASIGWLVFSNLFSVYVGHSANYVNLYGTMYRAAMSFLWLYCCVSIVFYGGGLNRWLKLRGSENLWRFVASKFEERKKG
jgi:membrane protein